MITEIILSKDQIGLAAAKAIQEAIGKVVSEKGRCVLGIPGGRSAGMVFSQMKDLEIAWEKTHIFMADERCVPADHEDSNYKIAHDELFCQLLLDDGIPQSNIHPFKAEDPESYESEFLALGGSLDIVLLSAGEDGHIASLFPNGSVLDDNDLFVMITDSPKPPSERISMSRKLISSATTAIVMFVDDAKKEALDKFKDESVEWKENPVNILRDVPEVFVLTNIGGEK